MTVISYFTNDFESSYPHWNIIIKKKRLGTFYGQTKNLACPKQGFSSEGMKGYAAEGFVSNNHIR